MTDRDDDFDYRALFGGRYMTGPDVPTTGQTFTIAAAGVEVVEDPKTKAERDRLVVYWAERGVKPWLPCRTTAGCLEALWGAKVNAWKGRQVTIYHDVTVKVGPKVIGGVRVLGSPQLDAPRDVTISLGARKPPAKVRLIPTGDPLAVVLASLDASEAALVAHLQTLTPPKTLPAATDTAARARWAASLRGAAPDAPVLTAIKGTAARADTQRHPDPVTPDQTDTLNADQA